MTRSDLNLAAIDTARPWWLTLRANGLLVLLVVLMWPAGKLVEHSPYLNEYYARIVLMIGINVILAVSLQLINGVAGQFSLGHAGFMAVGAYMAGYPTATWAKDFGADPSAASPSAVLGFFLALIIVLAIAAAIVLALVWAIRATRRVHRLLPTVLGVVAVLWLVIDIKLSEATGARPWLVWSGLARALVGAYEAMVAAGVRAAPAINAWVPLSARPPLTLLIALLGGGTMAALAGFLIGLPTLRLRGDYLAIATLGFAEIIRVAVINSDALGKATGLSVPAFSQEAVPEDHIAARNIFPWIYGAMIITVAVIWRITRSMKGRALQAIREDETAATAMGVDPTHHKVLAFVVGAFFAGVAGGLFAHYDGYLNPNSFGIMRSIEIVVMVTLGGLGSISGAILAAIILTWLPEFLRSPADWLVAASRPFGVTSLSLPDWLTAALKYVGDRRMVFYSLLLIAMMLLRPRGLLGGKELWWRRRAIAPPSVDQQTPPQEAT